MISMCEGGMLENLTKKQEIVKSFYITNMFLFAGFSA